MPGQLPSTTTPPPPTPLPQPTQPTPHPQPQPFVPSGIQDQENQKRFDFLLDLLRTVLKFEPNDRGTIKGHFECPQASYFNKKINEHRKRSGKTPVGEHDHNPEFTKAERSFAVKDIAKEIQKYTYPLEIISQTPNEIIYGNADDPDRQLKYTFEEGKWLITPGINVDAIIIDPAGKVIEIKPGPHVQQYGDGGNLMVAGVCKGSDNERLQGSRNKQHATEFRPCFSYRTQALAQKNRNLCGVCCAH